MINLKRRFNFQSGSGEALSYTLVPSNSCASVSPASGTVSSGSVQEFDFNFANADCFDTVFTLTTIDPACSNPTVQSFSFPSPCSTLSATIAHTPTSRAPYRFTVSPIGGQAGYTYLWSFNTELFTNTRANTTSSIELRLNTNQPPTFTELTCRVTDSNGCEFTVVYVYVFCKPQIASQTVQLECVPSVNNLDLLGTVNLSSTDSCSPINWTTLETTSTFTVTNQGSTLTIKGKSRNTASTDVIDFTVKNELGIEGNFSLTVVHSPCEIIKTPTILAPDVVLVADYAQNDVVEIALTAIETEPIDFDTFTFIAADNQTLVNATSLTGLNGAAIYKSGSKTIEYTIGATKNENVEILQYQFDTIAGSKTNVAKTYIDFEPYGVPVATNDSLTVAAGATGTLNLASNDTGDIDFSTFEIVSTGTKGLMSISPSGVLTYTANSTSEGSDTITYRFKSTNGILSNTATITVTIQNAGANAQATICPDTISLPSFLTSPVTAGGTWAAGSNPTSVDITDPTDVDFSAANAGVYTFTYTVGASVSTLTLTLPDYGAAITSVSAPTNNPLAAAITSTVFFSSVGISSASNILILVNFNSGVNIDVYPPDLWDGNSGQAVITYGEGAGPYVISVQYVDDCGDFATVAGPTITI